jgi:hypothetical protein
MLKIGRSRFFSVLQNGQREVIDPWKPRSLRAKPNQLRLYKPSKILEFDKDGTLLLYSYTHSPIKTLGRFLKWFIPTATSTTLLIKNPYPCNLYTVSAEPLSLPFFLTFTMYGMWKTWTGMARYTITLHEAKLLRDGMHIEIGLLNYLGSKMEYNKYTLNINDLTSPPTYADSRPLFGDLFPTRPDEFELKAEDRQPWVKYYDVVRRRLFIPKDYDYMDKELMVAVMNGVYIDTTNN